MISAHSEHAGQTGQKDSPYWGAVLSVRPQDTTDKADGVRCVRPVRRTCLNAMGTTEAVRWLDEGLVTGRQSRPLQAPRRHP